MKTLTASGPDLGLIGRTGQPVERSAKPIAAGLLMSALALTAPAPAHAVDGCLILLCFAAPDWSAIPQCVSPVKQVLRDLARGRPFPTCAMAGRGNSGSHRWASAPDNCPAQYTRYDTNLEPPVYYCDYSGAVSIKVNGALWTRTWWTSGGKTVTEFTDAAKAQLGTWDTRFEDDYAEWLASQLPPVDPNP